MAYEDHVGRGHPIVFGLMIFFGIVEGAISTWLTQRFATLHNAPTQAIRIRSGLVCFTSWWTVIFAIVYIALFMGFSRGGGNVLTSLASHGVWLFLTWILWTASAASITTALGGGVNCSNIDYNLTYCNQLVAEEAFAWVEFLLFTFALAIVVVSGIRAGRSGDGWRGQLV